MKILFEKGDEQYIVVTNNEKYTTDELMGHFFNLLLSAGYRPPEDYCDCCEEEIG